MISRLCISSPVGPLKLEADNGELTGLRFGEGPSEGEDEVLGETVRQLEAYFAKDLTQFSLPLKPSGTPFQMQVWSALESIEFGETVSYLQIAQAIDNPQAVRAVGAANGQNPISIIVPCHRVIGSDGSLTGYGGGMDAKKWLLAHESPQVGLPF